MPKDLDDITKEEWDVILDERAAIEHIVGDMYPTDEMMYVEEEE